MTYLRENWRPLLAMTYSLICLADFLVFPLIWQIFFQTPWIAQSIKDGGMLHISFGAILGAAAYTRGAEKIQALKAQLNTSNEQPGSPT